MKRNIIIVGSGGYIGSGVKDRLSDNDNLLCLDKAYLMDDFTENTKLFKFDLSNKDDIEQFISHLKEEGISIDGIVNVAGTNNMSSFYTTTEEEWDITFNINLKYFIFFLKSIYSFLSNKVSIVNVASQNGVVAHEDRISYGTSKAALIHLTKNLSIDFLKDKNRDIKVNCVSPSYIINDSNRDYLASIEGKKLLKKIPYKKFVEVEDVTNAIHFLLSEESDAIRGQNIIIDYGYTLV
jgi:NAD(P)-dependent dehydrogenase (short-subunit alcohol dehydrogenase family)